MFTRTLPAPAQKSLAVLGKSNCLPPQTYLAGGSGLSLYLGHRISVDFDFFTPQNFNQEMLATALSQSGQFTTTSINPDTLLGVFDETKFSIFRYQYPLLFPTNDCQGIQVADKRDIAAMKIAAVMDRGTKKDFIDLYFLEKDGITLTDSLKLYNRKYGSLASNAYSILKSLTYFVDAEESEMPRMVVPVVWDAVKKYFQEATKKLAKEILSANDGSH